MCAAGATRCWRWTPDPLADDGRDLPEALTPQAQSRLAAVHEFPDAVAQRWFFKPQGERTMGRVKEALALQRRSRRTARSYSGAMVGYAIRTRVRRPS